MTEIVNSQRQAKINDMRSMLDFLETHQEMELPFFWSFWIYPKDVQTIRKYVKMFGTCKKEFNDDSFRATKQFGGLTLIASISRETVCEKVVTGYEDVPETVIPEKVTPATVVPAHKKELIEWRCNPVIADNAFIDLTEELAESKNNLLDA